MLAVANNPYTMPAVRPYCRRQVTGGLGQRIAVYRRRRGISQVALAGLVGRTEDWLSKVENGKIEVDRLSVIRTVAAALRIDVPTLLDGLW